jgi:activating signal cointegrator complex subunit 3
MKKNFYKKFIYEPFPVESSLLTVLADHLNAEIVAGTIKTRQEALDYLTWTYFFRRLLRNPTYYGLDSLEEADINRFLSTLIEKSLIILEEAQCISLHDVSYHTCG